MRNPTVSRDCQRPDLGPYQPHNPPGQPSLQYRISDHGTFLRRMLARLSEIELGAEDGSGRRVRPLSCLSARDSEDPAVALLDAWAVVADVLTFYQERIANEGFLRTAAERRSVLELARSIGYELRPGVSASTVLTFSVDDGPQSPEEATIPAGTAVRSIPAAGGLPQTYETSIEFLARRSWNALEPRRTREQDLDGVNDVHYVEGLSSGVEANDWVLVVRSSDPGNPNAYAEATPRRVLAVTPEPELGRTRLDLDVTPVPRPLLPKPIPVSVPFTQWVPSPMTAAMVQSQVVSQTWRQPDLGAYLRLQRWSPTQLARHINRPPLRRRARQVPRTVPPQDPLPYVAGIHRFTARLGAFGHNAPRHGDLPDPQSEAHDNWDANANGLPISRGSTSNTPYATRSGFGMDFYTERTVKGVHQGSWVLLDDGRSKPLAVQVRAVRDQSLAEYTLSGKATGFDVQRPDGTNPGDLSSFRTRSTTILAASEPLPLARLPIQEDVGAGSVEADQLTLSTLVLDLAEGQSVVLTGERADLPGVTASEVLVLDDVFHSDGFTTLVFREPIRSPYVRDTVTLNANAVPATHGETIPEEVLGSGDATRTFQGFQLRRPPLTHVPAATSSGAAAALTIRVDGVEWTMTDRLFGKGPHDRVFIVRHDDDGTVRVRTGDGVEGARLPTGTENVRAHYRSGLGLQGQVEAQTLTLLAARPPGIREVTNPQATAGAADPEGLIDARSNAPRTVLTLDRIVSIRDAEHFAQSFAGIGKARADRLWNGAGFSVCLTLADENGNPFVARAETVTALRGALQNAHVPGPSIEIRSFLPLFFNLQALLRINDRYGGESVIEAARRALEAAFSFHERGFGQAVTAAEVMTRLQDVEGVVAVDLDRLFRTDDPGGPLQTRPAVILPAAQPHWDGTALRDAELLLINPAGVLLSHETVSAP